MLSGSTAKFKLDSHPVRTKRLVYIVLVCYSSSNVVLLSDNRQPGFLSSYYEVFLVPSIALKKSPSYSRRGSEKLPNRDIRRLR